MAAFDGTATLTGHSAANTTHNLGNKTSAGSQRFGTVDLRFSGPSFPTEPLSVTWGGVTMEEIGAGAEIANAGGVRSFGIVDPPLAATAVVVNCNGSVPVGYSVRSWNDVDPDDPVGDVQTNSGNDTTPTVNVASAVGRVVADVCAVANVFSGSGGGQTLDDEFTDGGAYTARTSHEDGAATVTMSHSMGSSANWVIQAYSLNAPAAGGPAVLPFRTTIGAMRVR